MTLVYIDPARVRTIAGDIAETRNALVTPPLESVDSCGSPAVRDALAIASSMIVDQLVTGRKQIGYIVDSLEATVEDFEASEANALHSIVEMRRRIR